MKSSMDQKPASGLSGNSSTEVGQFDLPMIESSHPGQSLPRGLPLQDGSHLMRRMELLRDLKNLSFGVGHPGDGFAAYPILSTYSQTEISTRLRLLTGRRQLDSVTKSYFDYAYGSARNASDVLDLYSNFVSALQVAIFSVPFDTLTGWTLDYGSKSLAHHPDIRRILEDNETAVINMWLAEWYSPFFEEIHIKREKVQQFLRGALAREILIREEGLDRSLFRPCVEKSIGTIVYPNAYRDELRELVSKSEGVSGQFFSKNIKKLQNSLRVGSSTVRNALVMVTPEHLSEYKKEEEDAMTPFNCTACSRSGSLWRLPATESKIFRDEDDRIPLCLWHHSWLKEHGLSRAVQEFEPILEWLISHRRFDLISRIKTFESSQKRGF